MSATKLHQVRAQALFACDLQPSERPHQEEVRRAVTVTLRRRGHRWCAERVAQEFGDHPEIAVHRMAWALETTHHCFPTVATPPFAWIHIVREGRT